jgi:hypothetical protein
MRRLLQAQDKKAMLLEMAGACRQDAADSHTAMWLNQMRRLDG